MSDEQSADETADPKGDPAKRRKYLSLISPHLGALASLAFIIIAANILVAAHGDPAVALIIATNADTVDVALGSLIQFLPSLLMFALFALVAISDVTADLDEEAVAKALAVVVSLALIPFGNLTGLLMVFIAGDMAGWWKGAAWLGARRRAREDDRKVEKRVAQLTGELAEKDAHLRASIVALAEREARVEVAEEALTRVRQARERTPRTLGLMVLLLVIQLLLQFVQLRPWLPPEVIVDPSRNLREVGYVLDSDSDRLVVLTWSREIAIISHPRMVDRTYCEVGTPWFNRSNLDNVWISSEDLVSCI